MALRKQTPSYIARKRAADAAGMSVHEFEKRRAIKKETARVKFNKDGQHMVIEANEMGEVSILPPSTPGSFDWSVRMFFGDRKTFISYLESLIQTYGGNPAVVDPSILVFVKVAKRGGSRVVNLNQAIVYSGADPQMILKFASTTFKEMVRIVAEAKLVGTLPEVIEATRISALVPGPDGYKDREIVYKMTGLLTEGPGIIVTNNNNSLTLQGANPSPLNQFKDTILEVESEVRRALPPAVENGREVIDVLPEGSSETVRTSIQRNSPKAQTRQGVAPDPFNPRGYKHNARDPRPTEGREGAAHPPADTRREPLGPVRSDDGEA